MKAGVSSEKLADLPGYAESPRYTARERAALALADRMTRTDRDVDDEFFREIQALFPTEELVELAAVIAAENFRSKFNNAFRVAAQGFCVLPKRGDT